MSKKAANYDKMCPPTREQIICELWQSADLRTAIGKMKPVELQDDLRQEIFVVLCEMDAERLEQLYRERKLNLYIFGMMRNMIISNESTFYYKHRKFGDWVTKEPTEDLLFDRTDGSHIMMEGLEPAISSLDPYEAGMIQLYADMGRNCQPIAKATGIQVRSVRYVVTAAKEKLKKKLRSHVD